MPHFAANEIVALIIATSFAAGLNVYATVATLGLLGHFHVLQLPPHLHTLDNWWVIGIAVAMFVVEFFADKIPYFDLLWNALHTFVRVPVAALIAYGASAQLSPQMQVTSAVLASAVAMAAHTGKTAARVGVTPSPEPFSNMGLSAAEDVTAIGLTWFASRHPFIAAGIVIALLVILVVLTRWIVRALKRMWRRLTAGPQASAQTT